MAIDWLTIGANTVTGLMWFLAICIAGLGIFFATKFMGFKHKFRIRKLTSSGKNIIIDDKFKIFEKKGHGQRYKLMKTKYTAPIAPNEAIDIDKKGNYVIEAYYSEDGEFTYISNDPAKMAASKTWRDPLTTDDKDFYAQEYVDAKKYDSNDWKNNIPQIAAVSGVVLIAILLIVFWGDMAAPMLELSNNQAGIAEKQRETTGLLQEMIQKKQFISEEDIPGS